jgi:hypothetical protein
MMLVLRMAGAVLLLRELDQLASTIPRCYAGIRSIGGLPFLRVCVFKRNKRNKRNIWIGLFRFCQDRGLCVFKCYKCYKRYIWAGLGVSLSSNYPRFQRAVQLRSRGVRPRSHVQLSRELAALQRETLPFSALQGLLLWKSSRQGEACDASLDAAVTLYGSYGSGDWWLWQSISPRTSP